MGSDPDPVPREAVDDQLLHDRTQSARTDHEPVRPRARPAPFSSMSGVPANLPLQSARDDNLVGDGGQGGQEVDGLRPRADGEGDGIAAGCRVRPSDRLPERSGPGVIGVGHRECRRCKPVLQRLNQ